MNTMLVVFIMGFGATENRSALPRLARAVQEQNPQATVKVYRWNQHAELLAYLSTHEFETIIFVGHSYGVSTGMFVAAKLQNVIKIAHFVSIDGVWRADLERLSFRSLRAGAGKISVSPNVAQLHTFRQTKGLIITGHGFQIDPEKTTWPTNVITCRVRHARMDRFQPVWDLTLALSKP